MCQIFGKTVRAMEDEISRYRNEDTDLHRQIAHMQTEHNTALMRAEESGYAKGLRDGRELAPNEFVRLPANYNKLTWQERRAVRNEYVRQQKGLCSHCKEPLSGIAAKKIMAKPINKRLFPANFFQWPIHLHHDHDTGMIIGAVHCHCNAVLWQHHGE